MRKKFLFTQTIFLTLTLGLSPIGCLSLQPHTKIPDISSIDMKPVNVKVKLNVDTYQEVLTSDDPNSFKSLLIKNLNDFANQNNISLRYAQDYYFSLSSRTDEDIDPYSIITKFETLRCTVKITNHNPKVKGKFNVPVNFIKRPKSITEVVIPDQNFEAVVINKTTFLDALTAGCIRVIRNRIKKIEPEAQLWTDYTINIESHSREDKITEDDLGIQYVNVNSLERIGQNPGERTGLLEGDFTFVLILSVPKENKK